MPTSRALAVAGLRASAVAGLGAVAAVIVAIAIRIALPTPNATGSLVVSTDALVPLLVAGAALCVTGLTIARRPGVAWLAIVVALAIVTIDVATTLRGQPTAFDTDGRRWLAIVLCVVAIGAVAAAVAYASSPVRRLGRWLPIVGALALAWMLGASGWALAALDAGGAGGPTGSLGSLGIVTRSMLALTPGFVGFGLLGDARVPAARARRRLAVMRPAPTTLTERGRHAAAFARLFLDEVSPGRSRAHRAALDERSRIARDLHADVVPAVRRALVEAEHGGSATRLAGSLREVLTEVDRLVAAEHTIVLDVSGFVAALEALAERTEDRSAVRVTIDIATDDGEAPTEVAAAALRVATLALDNVARHADGSSVVVMVHTAPDRLALIIEDEGPGLRPEARQSAVAAGRRGLADMAAEAAACGGAVEIDGRADGASGTRIGFVWPAD